MIKSVKKLIAHPLFVGVFCLLAGFILSEYFKKNSPPVAKVVPNQLSVTAAENVTFSASESNDADNDELTFKWTVAGGSINTTSIAFCKLSEDNSQLSCKFTSPGNHIVTVEVKDEHNESTSALASVRVTIPGGYVGFIIQYGSTNKDLNLIRAVNYAIDWVKIQSILRGKPIVIYDPDSNSDIFAVNIERSIRKAKQFIEESNGGSGLKILVPSNIEIRKQIQVDLNEAGIQANVIQMPFGEVLTALTKGLTNTGFVPLSNGKELLKYYK